MNRDDMRHYTNKAICRSVLSGWLLLLTGCTTEKEYTLKVIDTTVLSPTIYLYVEDIDGNDLIAAGQPFKAWAADTGQPLECHVIPGVQPLPWGEQGRLLAVELAPPFHDPYDDKYVYTTYTNTMVSIGYQDIQISQRYDTTVKHYKPEGGGHGVKADFTPACTYFMGHQLESDTAHIIIESDHPVLRMEGEEMLMEMRFPAISDSLATLPVQSLGNNTWGNELLELHDTSSGRTTGKIRQASVSVANCTDESTGERYSTVAYRFRLPYLYDIFNIAVMNFHLSWNISSPILYGDDSLHYYSVQIFDYLDGRGLVLNEAMTDFSQVNAPSAFTTKNPYSIVFDCRDIVKNHNHEQVDN